MHNNTQLVIDQLMDYLETYLQSKGIEIKNSMFRCINPEHDDKNPSCSIGGRYNKRIFKCFSCNSKGNIFHAAHYLENLPIGSDPEFYTQTLPILANRFGIPYSPRELTEEEKETITLRKSFEDASDIITGFALDNWDKDVEFVNFIKERDINKNSIIDFGIGSIPSVNEFKKRMMEKGWSEDYLLIHNFLEREDRKDKLFAPGKIIITVRDHLGRPCAFVSRMVNWTKESGKAKYVNSMGSSIYKKSHVLFGFDLAKSEIRKKPLIIVEGYIDVITLRQAGIKNVAGLGSATLDDEVLDLLNADAKRRTREIRNITLCFDNDKSGFECTRRAIEDFGKRPNIAVEVKELPKGIKDPDELIRKEGSKLFENLDDISTFKWLLKHREVEQSEEEFIKSVCKDISNEDSPIVRRMRAKDLSEIAKSFNITDIIAQIDYERGEKSSQMQSQMENIFTILDKKRRSSRGSDNIKIAQEALADLKRIQKDYNQRHGDPQKDYLKNIENTINVFNKTKEINGFYLGKYKQLQKALDGYPDKECLITLAGDSNIGKSSIIRELSWEIATNNKDAIVMYMSIDDSTRDVLQGIVAREAMESRDRVYKITKQSEQTQINIEKAWNKVKDQKNYIVVDSTQGNTIMHLQDHIEYMKREFPNKKPILFLDNFHKLRSGEHSQIREKFIDIVQTIKDITQEYDIPITMTVELRKIDNNRFSNRPTLTDIAETKQIEYDSKLIFLCYQEMHYKPETAVSWRRETYSADKLTGDGYTKMPYLEMKIAKNKHTDKKISLGYKFETDRSIITEVDYSEYQEREKQEEERILRKKHA